MSDPVMVLAVRRRLCGCVIAAAIDTPRMRRVLHRAGPAYRLVRLPIDTAHVVVCPHPMPATPAALTTPSDRSNR